MKKTVDNWVKPLFPQRESVRGEQYVLVASLVLMSVFMLVYKMAG